LSADNDNVLAHSLRSLQFRRREALHRRLLRPMRLE
jgi:hypothetical protein